MSFAETSGYILLHLRSMSRNDDLPWSTPSVSANTSLRDPSSVWTFANTEVTNNDCWKNNKHRCKITTTLKILNKLYLLNKNALWIDYITTNVTIQLLYKLLLNKQHF